MEMLQAIKDGIWLSLMELWSVFKSGIPMELIGAVQGAQTSQQLWLLFWLCLPLLMLIGGWLIPSKPAPRKFKIPMRWEE